MKLPEAFMTKYEQLLGDEASDFFTTFQQNEASKAFRVNTMKPNWEILQSHSLEPFPAEDTPYAKESYYGSVNGKSPAHQAGYIYSQEPSAMVVGTVADAQPNERVLDLCAAPGGKSTHLSNQMHDTGVLVSNEIIPKRAKILSENIERWGCTHTVVTNYKPKDLESLFPNYFDRIVVDAPCSGEGMFKKSASAIADWSLDYVTLCANRQRKILESAMKLLRPNGLLIYSTCTFSPEENEEIISWLVTHYPVTIEPIELPKSEIPVSHGRPEWGSVEHLDRTLRLWPHYNQGDGHFVAKLRFLGEALPALPHKKSQIKKGRKTYTRDHSKTQRLYRSLNKSEHQYLESFLETFPISLDLPLIVKGNQLWAIPTDLPNMDSIRWLRCGLHVGTFLKNRFEPSFALAMAIRSTESLPTIALNEEQWQRYMSGETLSIEGNLGWVLLTFHTMPVAFGKQVQNIIKNAFPKGLRFYL